MGSSSSELADGPDRPPIQLVAAKLQELRRAANVISATPEDVEGREAELHRITGEYDILLMVAARQVGLELAPLQGDGTLLPPELRRQIEHEIRSLGFVLDR